MAEPKVSVYLASYNHAGFLAQALDSVLAQTHRNLELVLVDDGSTDASLAIAQSYAKRHADRILVLTHPDGGHRGISASVNLAIRHATGAYCAAMSSDDVWDRDMVAVEATVLDRHPDVGLVYAQATVIDGAGGANGRVIGEDVTREPGPLARLLIGDPIPGCAIMVRRACVEAVGPYDEALVYSDWELWLRIAARWGVMFLDRPLASYRVHAANTSVGRPVAEHLAHSLAGLRALREKAPAIGGALARPEIRAGIEAQISWYLFQTGKISEAEAALETAFRLLPDPARDPLFLWLCVRGKDRVFVGWLLRRLWRRQGRPSSWRGGAALLSALARGFLAPRLAERARRWR